MSYAIIQPPFTLKFEEMSKAELKAYYNWFMEQIPVRVAILEVAVKGTPGFVEWRADFSPDSLKALGEWYALEAETRPRTKAELEEIKQNLSFPIDIPDYDLTNKTFSLAMDIGMYLSQVFIKKFPQLHWDLVLKNKRDVDYGQPVLIKFNPAPFNPVNMMVVLAYGLVKKSKSGGRLFEIYNIWSEMISK